MKLTLWIQQKLTWHSILISSNILEYNMILYRGNEKCMVYTVHIVLVLLIIKILYAIVAEDLKICHFHKWLSLKSVYSIHIIQNNTILQWIERHNFFFLSKGEFRFLMRITINIPVLIFKQPVCVYKKFSSGNLYE